MTDHILNYKSLLGQAESFASLWVSTAQGNRDGIIYYMHDLKNNIHVNLYFVSLAQHASQGIYGFL